MYDVMSLGGSVVGDGWPSAPRASMKHSLIQVCPSINRNCGVGNFARNFADAMISAGVSVETLETFPPGGQGDLIVQHEFGLFNTDQLRQDISRHRGRVFMLAHSPRADLAFSVDVSAFVTLCDGMTSPTAVVHVLPHPGWQQVPLLDRESIKNELGWSGYRCVIGTNGLISPTRAFDEVVASLAEFALRENILIHVICPPHHNHDNRNGYGGQEMRLRSLSERFPRNIQLEMQFLDQSALNRRLQAMDIAWCWTNSASLPYGSGTCSDQYGSGTRLVAANKRQHSHILGLPNVVTAPAHLPEFVAVLKAECMRASFPRHDPSPVAWSVFAKRIVGILQKGEVANSMVPSCSVSVSTSVAPQIADGGLTVANSVSKATEFLGVVGDVPKELGASQGIVICAGGIKYFSCAWVAIRSLRQLGCRLPIEVWCYDDEFNAEWRDLVRQFDVTVRTTSDLTVSSQARWRGWRLKSIALLGSSFGEVLLLDADVVPVRDPTFLFKTKEYCELGALFWPDRLRSPRHSDVWKVFGVTYVDEPDQESGQLVIDKRRCWSALNLCRWYNGNAEFFYRYVYGDKDTYRLAWRRTKTPFAMPSKAVAVRDRYLLQFDFSGQPLFQHRVHAKWTLEHSLRLSGFVHEEACLGFLRELREQWNPIGQATAPLNLCDVELSEEVASRKWRLTFIGLASWKISLDVDGVVSGGAARDVSRWWIRDGTLFLATVNREPRYLLTAGRESTWVGSSLSNSRIRAQLVVDT